MTDDRNTWKLQGACFDSRDPRWMDGHLWHRNRKQDIAELVAVCAGCPVRQECQDYIMDLEAGAWSSYRSGLWAGLTPPERQLLDLGHRA